MTRRRTARSTATTLAGAALLTGLLAACGSSAAPASSTAAAAPTSAMPSMTSPMTSPTPSMAATSSAPEAGARISIKDFAYGVPASVPPGASVTVVNDDSVSHTVTAKGAFDVKVAGHGGTATFTAPTTPGSYPFVCDFHASMKGVLVVR